MLGIRGGVSSQLAMNYHANSCPNLEQLVRATMTAMALTDPTTPAALLRLLFHDCQVQGCDASILLDSEGSITSELVSDRNFGIRKINAIDRIKSVVEAACPSTVSCADIIALAARDAVLISGGPAISIPLGRRDSLTASNVLADEFLPSAYVSVDGMLNIFAAKGMSVEETVAILGAHTLGIGHCVNVVKRLYPQKDTNLGFFFGNFLRINCPTAVPFTNKTFITNDLTSLRFDNQYYRDIRSGRGLFSIDSAMAMDPRTALTVSRFADDQNLFFQAFSSAFVKLSVASVLTVGMLWIETCQIAPSVFNLMKSFRIMLHMCVNSMSDSGAAICIQMALRLFNSVFKRKTRGFHH
eukprot:Gb_15647 [translate_table: standard]